MKLLFEENWRVPKMADAFTFNATQLYRILLDAEFGIEYYQTDVILDIIHIVKALMRLDAENETVQPDKPETVYRHAIGTRLCGTYNADDEAERDYWRNQTIGIVGVEVERSCGSVTVRYYKLAYDDVPALLAARGNKGDVEMPKKYGVTLVDYSDVFFDEDSGFIVNNVMKYDNYTEPMTAEEFSALSDAEILDIMKSGNGPVLQGETTLDDIRIDGDISYVEIEYAESGEPLCRLELNTWEE